jgi:hypothetical protein
MLCGPPKLGSELQSIGCLQRVRSHKAFGSYVDPLGTRHLCPAVAQMVKKDTSVSYLLGRELPLASELVERRDALGTSALPGNDVVVCAVDGPQGERLGSTDKQRYVRHRTHFSQETPLNGVLPNK